MKVKLLFTIWALFVCTLCIYAIWELDTKKVLPIVTGVMVLCIWIPAFWIRKQSKKD